MEPFFPLHVHVCGECFLVQLEEYVTPDKIFSADYPYYSSFSDSWVEHARRYVEHVQQDFGIGSEDLVVELASNDGYLLQHFVASNVPCLGIEPAEGVAEAAQAKGIPTITRFFGTETARDVLASHGQAQLILGNNVLAHVPDLNDFVEGVRVLLGERGFATFEFPHLLQLMTLNQFDTIYHEHFSYLSFVTVEKIFAHHGLALFDVEELPTHGGSLRIFARHIENTSVPLTERMHQLREREIRDGFLDLGRYGGFEEQVKATKWKLLSFLIDAKQRRKSVAAYGAPGKGNTLLNYCGIRTDFVDFAVDANPYKHGKFTPGTRIPIFAPERLREIKPDYVLILPWNLKDEITAQAAYIGDWGGKFVVPIPEVRVL